MNVKRKGLVFSGNLYFAFIAYQSETFLLMFPKQLDVFYYIGENSALQLGNKGRATGSYVINAQNTTDFTVISIGFY